MKEQRFSLPFTSFGRFGGIENEETKAMSTNAGQQQVAIVTGASSGLGLGITRALLQRGFRVVGNSRTVSKSKELKPS